MAGLAAEEKQSFLPFITLTAVTKGFVDKLVTLGADAQRTIPDDFIEG